MNKTKMSIKKSAVPVKKASKQFNSKLWVIVSAVLSVVLIAAIMFDQLYKRPIITIDGDKYYLEDLSYYFFEVESQYDSMTQLFGASYWDMSFDGSSSVRDMALEEAVNNSLTNEILYREAIAEGYTLTDEDKAEAATNLENLKSGALTDEVKAKAGFTDEYLTGVSEKITLLNRYREDKVEAFDIDDEAIKASVNYDDFRQYDIESVFISTKSTDADGNSVDKSEAEISEAENKIKLLYSNAESTEDWSTLIPEGDEELNYSESNFIESDSSFSEDFTAIVTALENGGITEVYKEDSGYYFVRMVNNNSSESYDTEVKTAIETEETEQFNELVTTIFDKYDYDIHNGGLRTLTMGKVTLP